MTRRFLIPSLACWVTASAPHPSPAGRARFFSHPAFHTGRETIVLEHTVVFRHQLSMPGSPLATGRYRR